MAPKRRDYSKRQYSPPPEKKPVLQKGKIKQQQLQEKKIKEKKIKTNQEIMPDLSTIPLPGESIQSKTENKDEKLTKNNTTESQPDASNKTTTVASTDNITLSQMWGQPAVITTPQYNAMYDTAFSNQQQSIQFSKVATPTAYSYTQTSPLNSVQTQEAVAPEKPKPTIVDRRFVKNEETLQEL